MLNILHNAAKLHVINTNNSEFENSIQQIFLLYIIFATMEIFCRTHRQLPSTQYEYMSTLIYIQEYILIHSGIYCNIYYCILLQLIVVDIIYIYCNVW